jgi:hypothetical protein
MWQDNIEMDPRDIGCKDVSWIQKPLDSFSSGYLYTR